MLSPSGAFEVIYTGSGLPIQPEALTALITEIPAVNIAPIFPPKES